MRVSLSDDLGVKEPAGRKIVATAINSAAAAAFGGSRALRARWPGLGRCTRMHKGLKPRSMSETGHLPTDVESSDPGAATLQPGPLSPLFLSPPLVCLLTLLLLVSSSFAPGALEPSDSLHRENLCLLVALCESHPIFSTCLAGPPPDCRVFFGRKKQRAFQERYSSEHIYTSLKIPRAHLFEKASFRIPE